MNKIQCGICHTDKSNDGFYCSSCTSFRLLKHRLNLIHLQSTNQRAVNDINQILELCSEGESRSFLESYLKGQSLPGVNEVNSDSIARLGFMLMNVNTMTQMDQLNKVNEIVQRKQEENTELLTKLKTLTERKKKLEERLKKLQNALSDDKQPDSNQLVSKRMVDLQYSAIKKTENKKLYQILNWWKFEENKGRISLMSIPIIPITNLTSYHMSVVLESFLKTCQFLNITSNIYGVRLTFTMGTFQNQLRVGDRILNVRDLARFSELSDYGRKEFCSCIAKILQNLIKLILHFDPDYRTTDLSFHDLLRFDKLLIHMGSILNERIQHENMTQTQQPHPAIEDKIGLLSWLFRKEKQASTQKVTTAEEVPRTEQEVTLRFQQSLELSSLTNPEVLSPPLLPPSAVDAWELLSSGKLTDALVELLV